MGAHQIKHRQQDQGQSLGHDGGRAAVPDAVMADLIAGHGGPQLGDHRW